MEASGHTSGGSTKKAVSSTVKAGLKFPVGKIERYLKKGGYVKRVGSSTAVYTAVYIAAVLEYIAAEVLELAGNAARDSNNSRIFPRHIQRAVKNDDELAQLIAKVSGTDPRVSLEVENIINQFGCFEL